jgi:ppGpp synthetase/RelA/SpoT-type nucleotidyltranferase
MNYTHLMPLTDHVIDSTVQRYRREVDCYEKLCRFVAMKCEREIIRENTIRAGITYRAKSPNKLGAKLRKKYKDLPDLNTEEQALKRLSDLAGVRISTYLEADRAKVVEEIRKQFVGPDGGAVEVDDKGGSGFYRATHCQVALKPEDLDEPYDNLAGLTCEIQVCSLLAHVWNELEHDLVYKPTTGTLSPRETDSLNILGNLTLSGDLVIKQLFEANAARLKEAQTDEVPFQDVFDFVVRIRDFFPEQLDFGSNAGQLFEDCEDKS